MAPQKIDNQDWFDKLTNLFVFITIHPMFGEKLYLWIVVYRRNLEMLTDCSVMDLQTKLQILSALMVKWQVKSFTPHVRVSTDRKNLGNSGNFK